MVVDGVLFEITKTPLVSGSFIRCKGVARIFQRGGGGGEVSHCVKHYRHGVLATGYYRLFS